MNSELENANIVAEESLDNTIEKTVEEVAPVVSLGKKRKGRIKANPGVLPTGEEMNRVTRRRKRELPSPDSKPEDTMDLGLWINDPDLAEALERRLFLRHEESKSDIIKLIFAERYDIEVKVDTHSAANERTRIRYWPVALENAFNQELKSGEAKYRKAELRTKILSEGLTAELASVKAGVSRSECAEWIKNYNETRNAADVATATETTAKKGKRDKQKQMARTAIVKKRDIQKLIAEMDPNVFLKHCQEIEDYLDGLK